MTSSSHCECRCDAFTRYGEAPQLAATLATLTSELQQLANDLQLEADQTGLNWVQTYATRAQTLAGQR